jgi:hypothetical protein
MGDPRAPIDAGRQLRVNGNQQSAWPSRFEDSRKTSIPRSPSQELQSQPWRAPDMIIARRDYTDLLHLLAGWGACKPGS